MSERVSNRVLTAPLLVFLLLVVGIVTTAIVTRHPSPDLEGAIEYLADGDLDRAERDRMLARTIDLARSAESLRGRWAGLLAAIAQQDREAFSELDARLPSGAARALPEEQRQWLDLGDPLLANVLAAMIAQASSQEMVALAEWRQVAAQARLTGNVFAGQLARAALGD